ncbi:MAG TPA: virulence factor SrfB [Candidatus Competibacteraceae bacterium]|nr:virulence factor SrfB [Candidatus Competibacteraceae bacterium]HQA26716.1 virulence factor SrfB [Candidatus Competibacteraceae bacterium]HQD57159.1 virulence factor SrfB [Candidatus Competibacteraceae bacterium]
MLAKLKRFGPLVNLIPNTAIQFLDFGFNLNEVRVSRAFLSETGADGHTGLTALYADDASGQFVTQDGRAIKPEQVYSINAAKAAAILDGCWLPIPFLRVREPRPDGYHLFDKGPTNWARARLVELPAPDADGHTHRLTLAFDTQLLPTREGRPYLAPSPLDMQSGEEFALSDAEADTGWFLEQEWVREWLYQRFHAFELRRRAPRRVDEAELRKSPDAVAAYLTVLTLLMRAVQPPRLRFTFVDDGPTARLNRPVEVDLVLDIGNSRTCGMLMESSGDDPVDMNDSYRLEMRDLSRPEQVYDEPFPSRIEFVRGGFGDEKLSRRSGRASAFLWPTVTRVGFEAQALSYFSHGTEGNTGLSSPKRYLWDTDPRHHAWRFNAGPDSTVGDSGPVTTGPFVGHLREDGEELAPGDPPAVTALFSRGALMSFFVAEVLLQAFVQANSPARRYERNYSDAPRRIRRMILTLPTAMPLAERKLFTRRVNTAVRLTWRALGLDESQAPEPFLQWDEATGTQIVFLYNEIKHNFQGDAALFFQVFGRVRDGYGELPCVRLASIDIGGGTTDLIITTYQLEGGTAVKPTQEFREGFNIAGDDVLCGLIERNVLPALLDAIRQSGAANGEELMARLLGANRGDQAERDRTLRRQFANQVALPLALELLHRYETTDLSAGNEAVTLRLADVYPAGSGPHEQVTAFLEEAVHAAGGQGFKLAEVAFSTTMLALDTTVRRILGQVLSDLCEVVYLYDCDYLLISGRPCRLPAVRAAILAKLPAPPDRIVSLHTYRVGDWYPFRAVSGRLTDPKTTAAVGAMVCALSEGQLYKFNLRSRELGMKSTARFVGVLEQTGRLKKENVLFANLELEDHKTRLPEATFDFYAPVFLGFRQLGVERWPATPLYRITFAHPQDARAKALPLKVVLERSTDENVDLDFKVSDVADANGNQQPGGVVQLKLQTLKDEYGYWLDTGIFSISAHHGAS